MQFIQQLLWRAFGQPSGILGRIGGKLMSGHRKQKIVEHLMKLLDIRAGDIVLEIGFGPGIGIQYAQRYVEPEGLVVGIDPSEVMLEIAGRRNEAVIKPGKVKLLSGTVEHVPFPDNYFDKAFAMNTMQLWPDPKAGLREVLRVLDSDGRLVLSFDGPARKTVTDESVEEKLKKAGFRQTEAQEVKSTLYITARTGCTSL